MPIISEEMLTLAPSSSTMLPACSSASSSSTTSTASSSNTATTPQQHSPPPPSSSVHQSTSVSQVTSSNSSSMQQQQVTSVTNTQAKISTIISTTGNGSNALTISPHPTKIVASNKVIITTIQNPTSTTQKVITATPAPNQRVVSVAPLISLQNSPNTSSSASSSTTNVTNTNGTSSSFNTPQIQYTDYNQFYPSTSSAVNASSVTQAPSTNVNVNQSATAINQINQVSQSNSNQNYPPPASSSQSNSNDHNGAVFYMYDQSNGNVDMESYEMEGHISHTAQAAPITVQWLVDNFEPAEGCSLRRSSLYNFYKHHCSEQILEPVNPASFGKLIRSVFLGLRTRRLGTRGNSKYHYYGIRVKATSQLNNMPEDSPPFTYRSNNTAPNNSHTHGNAHTPVVSASKRVKAAASATHAHGTHNALQYYDAYEQKPQIMSSSSSTDHWHSNHNHQQQPQQQQHQMPPLTTVISSTATHQNPTNVANSNVTQLVESQQAVGACVSNIVPTATTVGGVGVVTVATGDESTDRKLSTGLEQPDVIESRAETLPDLGTINVKNVINFEQFSIEDLMKFEEIYKDHCRRILELICNIKLSLVEGVWIKFWRSNTAEALATDISNEYEGELSNEKFLVLCQEPAVIEFAKYADYVFYQYCVDTLMPEVLREYPTNFLQQLRNFAKSLEGWLRNSLKFVPDAMKKMKLKVVVAFSLTLRRYITLNHVSIAVRSALSNATSQQQMVSDLVKVDISLVHDSAAWIFDCDGSLVKQIERDIKKGLEDQLSIEDWGMWLEAVINVYLQPHEGTDAYIPKAKSFLLNWTFYCSAVIRELTLRSAQSFGSFVLMRLLFDEFAFYLILNKVARAIRQSPVAVMCDLKSFTDVISSQIL